jgi:hypothetical protein
MEELSNTIYFHHEGNPVCATVVEHLSSDPKTLIIRPTAFQEEIGKEFQFQWVDGSWDTVAQLKRAYPQTFQSLLKTLESADY